MKEIFTKLFIAILFISFLGCSSSDDVVEEQKEEVITPPILPKPLTSIKINKITVTEMSFKNANGEDWDISPVSGPDVQFGIRDASDLSYINGSKGRSSIYKDVTNSQLPLVWAGITPVSIAASKIIFIELLDDDEIIGDPVGPVYFTLSDYTTGSNPYPAKITKTRTTLGVLTTTITLDVTWE